jgi:hypothetical protein
MISFDKKATVATWYDFARDGNNDFSDDEPDEKVEGLESFAFGEDKYRRIMGRIQQNLSVKIRLICRIATEYVRRVA